MRLELAERLRCPAGHASTPLIVVARAKRERELVEGTAGCPVCHLEARFVDGQLRFDGVGDRTAGQVTSAGAPPDVPRIAALLGLSEPGGAILLTGRYAGAAAAIAALHEVAVIIQQGAPMHVDEQVATVLGAGDRVPFTDGTFRGAALDAAPDAALPETFVADAIRAVAPGGRVMAAVAVVRPGGLTELARDDLEWVASVQPRPALNQLARSRHAE